MGEFELIRRFFRRGPGSGVVGTGGGGVGAGAGGVMVAGARGTDFDGTAGAGPVMLGIGDDCALLQAPAPGQVLAISCDMLIEGRHFFAGTDPAAIGHKSLAVNLSDLAAMGAQPLAFTLAIALPAIDEAWLDAFCSGMFGLADRHACPLIGGDTTRGPLAISITVFGQVPAEQALRRDGARPGDEVWVSGPLGGASFAVASRKAAGVGSAVGARDGTAGVRERTASSDATDETNAAGALGLGDDGSARRLDWPQPQVALGIALRGIAHAAIDLSDGVAGDLRHVLAASSAGGSLGADLVAADVPLDPSLVALPIEEALRHALTGGDDYELLFTAAPQHHQAVRTLCPTAGMIGRVRVGSGILLAGGDGRIVALEGTGFDHFSG